MRDDQQHRNRIAAELRKAGVSSFGSMKFVSHYLPNIIHQEEHIEAAVYGRYREGGGLLRFSAGMLVATDRRVIFVDHKPGYTSMDELTYDVVSGVKKVSNGFSQSLTLHTKLGDYVIRFANARGIDKFIRTIETYRLEVYGSGGKSLPKVKTATAKIEPAALRFLKKHEVGVLSTVDRSGNVHGAAIYYLVGEQNLIYWVTKASTQKARDVFTHQQAALTVFDAQNAETVQLQGDVSIVSDPDIQHHVMSTLIKPRQYAGQEHLPPITTIHEDSYVVLQIAAKDARYTDYKKRDR